MLDIYKIDLLAYAQGILKKYVIVVGIYAVITYIVFAFKYAGARKNLKTYAHNLNKLSREYNNNVE